jgi:hypothetical protein
MANWAFIIGITAYKQGHFNKLDCAIEDAKAMFRYCKEEAKFDEVFLFTDDSGSIKTPSGTFLETKPTATNLKIFLHEFFESPQLETGDNFWFFFSGHAHRQCFHHWVAQAFGHEGGGVDTAKHDFGRRNERYAQARIVRRRLVHHRPTYQTHAQRG